MPSAFNEKPRDRGGAAAVPNATPAEREAIGMVERLFKGSLAGFAAAGSTPAPADIGPGSGARASSGGQAGTPDADDRAAVYEPERYDGEAFEA